MKKTWIYTIVIAAIVVVAAGTIYFATASPGSTTNGFTGPNVFAGKIISGDTGTQTYTNVSVLTDEGCTADLNTGLANCTTKLQTKSGVLSFNYEHDMMAKPCLSAGDKADVQAFENGTAMVKRTYWAGGGA